LFFFNIIQGNQRQDLYLVVTTFVTETHLNNSCVYVAKWWS